MDKQARILEIKKRIAQIELAQLGDTAPGDDADTQPPTEPDKVPISAPLVRATVKIDAYHSGWLDTGGNEAVVPGFDEQEDVSNIQAELAEIRANSIAMSRTR